MSRSRVGSTGVGLFLLKLIEWYDMLMVALLANAGGCPS